MKTMYWLLIGVFSALPNLALATEPSKKDELIRAEIEGYFRHYFGPEAIVARDYTNSIPEDLDWQRNGEPPLPEPAFEIGFLQIYPDLICRLGIGYGSPSAAAKFLGPVPKVIAECLPIPTKVQNNNVWDLRALFLRAKADILARPFDLVRASLLHEGWPSDIKAFTVRREDPYVIPGTVFFIGHFTYKHRPLTEVEIPVHYTFEEQAGLRRSPLVLPHTIWSLDAHLCAAALEAGLSFP